jgi:hypothetical protein
MKIVKQLLDELVRIRQLLQTMAQVQEQCLQAQLEQARLLRRLGGLTTGEQPVIPPPPG